MKTKKWTKLLAYYKPYKKELFLDLLFSTIHSISVVIIPLLIKFATTNIVNFERHEAFYMLSLVAAGILGLFIVISFCQRYTKYQGNMLAAKVESDIKIDIFKHFQKQDFNFFDERKTGGLLSNIISDAYNLTTLIKQIPETILDFTVRLIGTGIILFMVSPTFGIITFTILILLFSVAIYFIPKIQRNIEKSRGVYSELTSNLEERLSGIKTVKSFASEDKEISKCKDDINTYLKTKKTSLKLSATAEAIVDPILIGLIPIITIIAMFFVLSGKFTVSDLIVFMLYADILIGPLFNIFALMEGFNEGAVGFKRIFDILSISPEITDSPDAVDLENVKGNIKFKNVSFNYKSQEKIFEKLNLEINAGEYVAIVGPSGVGKSTLCNLIPRFYDVTEGEILIDNTPIKNVKLKTLRQNIGFVSQDIFLFSGSILDNIRYGNLDASDEEIIQAAKNAHAHEFILGLEKGYDTYIGERGAKLSGGQKQRVAIARAFLKNPPILIFDEATSSLDNESEKYIQMSMEKLAQNRTTIVIAHRLSTIKNAKRILVLNQTGIAEEGMHDELLSKNGIYENLYNLQFQKL